MNVTMKSLSQLRHHQQICKVGVWWVEFVPVSVISIISGHSWTLVPHPETPVKPQKMARQSLTCNNKSREQPAQFPCWEIRIHFGVPYKECLIGHHIMAYHFKYHIMHDYMHVCMYVCMYVILYIWFYMCLSVCLSVGRSVCLMTYGLTPRLVSCHKVIL